MKTDIKFFAKCPLTGRTEAIYVRYIRHENRWLPLLPNVCENGNGSMTCKKCIAAVVKQALEYEPPFLQ